MQREQTYAEERANDNTSEGSLGGIGAFENYEESESDAANSSNAPANQGETSNGESTNQGSQQSSSSAGGNSPENPGDRQGNEEAPGGETEEGLDNLPPDIPSGHDDDIVARQIREAAENETDPELRKKLWEEYRNYKNE